MSAEEVTAFEATTGWHAAVALRQRDDMTKESGCQVPGVAKKEPTKAATRCYVISLRGLENSP